MRLRNIWLTGIYKPALMVGLLGMLLAFALLVFIGVKFLYPSTTLSGFIVAVLTFVLMELVGYVADRLTTGNMNDKIESDLKWAVKIGRKYPQCRELCKSLNPMVTDEMMWNRKERRFYTSVSHDIDRPEE